MWEREERKVGVRGGVGGWRGDGRGLSGGIEGGERRGGGRGGGEGEEEMRGEEGGGGLGGGEVGEGGGMRGPRYFLGSRVDRTSLEYSSGGRDNIRIHKMSFFVMVKRNDQFLPYFCS